MNAQVHPRPASLDPQPGLRSLYEATLVRESAWTRIPSAARGRLIFSLWVITDVGLFAGLVDPTFWEFVLAFTAVHALAFTVLVGGRPLAFPAQLRIAYVGWLALGIYVPELRAMMYITTVGLTANLLFGYCPLARMLYLLPWNRDRPLTLRVFVRTFTQPPGPGRFAVTD